MKPSRLILPGIVFLPLLAFARLPKPETLPPDSVLEVGLGLYEQGKYYKATKYLDFYVLNFPREEKLDKAQFILAEAYYKSGRFGDAATEFEFLYKQFPSSEYAEEAEIKAAESSFEISEPYYKEQNITLEAKRMTESFLERYPESRFVYDARKLLERIEDKLARKELEGAKLYYKFDEYSAAVMMLEYTLVNYPLAKTTNLETKFYLALCKYELGEEEEALAILEELVDSEAWREKVEKKLARISKGKK